MSAHAFVLEAVRQEHRVLGHVIETLQHTLHGAAAERTEADFRLLAAILYYIDDFPERFHHPKEERHIFEALRARTRDFDALLDDLEHEHVRSGEMARGLHAALIRYIAGADGALELLTARADAYAALMKEHMRKEEDLLERAAANFVEVDWLRMLKAFSGSGDPLLAPNVRAEFRTLYRRIQTLLPRNLRYPAAR